MNIYSVSELAHGYMFVLEWVSLENSLRKILGVNNL